MPEHAVQDPWGFSWADDIPSAGSAFRRWMYRSALPFWAAAGRDQPHGCAQEHLDLAGGPGGASYKRMRVQARQIYAFSHAALLGWSDGERLAREGYRFICRSGERPEGGWVRRLSPDGRRVLDPATDLYDQAFVLFALAWYARLTGQDEPLDRARRTVAWIRSAMRQAPLGYRCVLPAEPGPRQQNPHMHLLEAALALYQTTGESDYIVLAHELVELFRQRLFDAPTGCLGEFFEPDWSPAAGADGDHLEPGHHFEWVWLLDQYEQITGADVGAEIEALYATGLEFGSHPDEGVIFDVIGRNGTVRRRSLRLWPQTEALKAHLAMHSRGARCPELVAKTVRNIGLRFLAGCPAGAWVDQFGETGAPAVDKIPTSSFYHLFMAFAELERACEGRPAASAMDVAAQVAVSAAL